MRQMEDYIPVELWHEAKDFIKNMDVDVSIFHDAQGIMKIAECLEAKKFCAYWSLKGYEKHPHALITLYENKPDIDDKYDIHDIVNPIECLQLRFRDYYLLLKDKGMIE